MLTNYLVLTIAVASATILFRTLKDDHPSFKRFIRELPLVGQSLSCGVCISYWFSLPVVIVADPLAPWTFFPTIPLVHFIASWLVLGVSVLFVRSLVIVLLEAAAVLKHRHQVGHAQAAR